jgi:hypothetical protein
MGKDLEALEVPQEALEEVEDECTEPLTGGRSIPLLEVPAAEGLILATYLEEDPAVPEEADLISSAILKIFLMCLEEGVEGVEGPQAEDLARERVEMSLNQGKILSMKWISILWKPITVGKSESNIEIPKREGLRLSRLRFRKVFETVKSCV